MLQLFGLRVLSVAISLNMLSAAGCQDKQRRPSRYLIPEGYVGWVRINYRVNDAPLLPLENGFYLLKFEKDGTINTRSEGEDGFASDEYYYVDSVGTRRPIPNTSDDGLIWGGVAFGSKTVTGQDPTKYSEFFVGTKEQFQQVGLKCKDSDLNPIVGPIENCLRKVLYN